MKNWIASLFCGLFISNASAHNDFNIVNLPKVPVYADLSRIDHAGLVAIKTFLSGCSEDAVIGDSKMCIQIESLRFGNDGGVKNTAYFVAENSGNAKVRIGSIYGQDAHSVLSESIYCRANSLDNGVLLISKDSKPKSYTAKLDGGGSWGVLNDFKIHCKYKGHLINLEAVSKPV